MSQDKPKPKVSRSMLYWVLPVFLISVTGFLIFSKGTDLGQSDDDLKRASEDLKRREASMAKRVANPADAAEQKLAEERKKAEANIPPLPPEPEQIKSDGVRLAHMNQAREVVADSLSKEDQEGTGIKAKQQEEESFVIYSAARQSEGILASAVNTTQSVVESARVEEQKAGDAAVVAASEKKHFSSNDDKVAAEPTVVASRVDGLYWLAPGTAIKAVLTNAIDTMLPGQFTARVTNTIYDSRYGKYPVVPAGSSITGSFDSAIENGQNRIMLAARTLVTPAGGTVNLNNMRISDALGRVGVEGDLNTHFWTRMGISTLLALESVAMSRLDKSETVTVTGTSSTTSNTSEAAKIIGDTAKKELDMRFSIKPNITLEEGHQITLITTGHIEVPPVANRR